MQLSIRLLCVLLMDGESLLNEVLRGVSASLDPRKCPTKQRKSPGIPYRELKIEHFVISIYTCVSSFFFLSNSWWPIQPAPWTGQRWKTQKRRDPQDRTTSTQQMDWRCSSLLTAAMRGHTRTSGTAENAATSWPTISPKFWRLPLVRHFVKECQCCIKSSAIKKTKKVSL